MDAWFAPRFTPGCKVEPSNSVSVDIAYNVVTEVMSTLDGPIIDVHETVQQSGAARDCMPDDARRGRRFMPAGF